MISHKYRCIFVHIQRTAGTSIENWIVGKDWWRIDKGTKHLLASQAKKKYRKYWDSYFKFSFVRNPWDRMVSFLIYPDFFGVTYKDGVLNLDGYKEKYGYPVTIENDFRFSNRKNLISKKHKHNAVYLNILDEELDFVGKFENLNEDTDYLQKMLKIKDPFKMDDKSAFSASKIQIVMDRSARLRKVSRYFHQNIINQTPSGLKHLNNNSYRSYYNKATEEAVRNIYGKDIDKFKYKY